VRNGKTYETSFNNGFIESMNNKVKLVKRNAYGYRYFYNLRKRILLHLGFSYEFE
ncbi:transposase, partial [Mediterraneibacter gnavus]